MKKLVGYIFEKAPYWIVFFIGWIVSTIFGFVICTLLNYIEEQDLELLKIFHLNLFLGFFIGGTMITYYISMFRK